MNYNTEIFINHRRIALSEPTYFIADIAANHDGDLDRAKELIYLAKKSGADCAKFQHFLANKIVSDYGFKHLSSGQSHQAQWKKSVYEVYEQYHCKRDWTAELVKTCQEVGIEFMTTPYDYEVVTNIDPYVHAYKIGSGDITWHDFLAYLSQFNKPLLISCGASNLSEVVNAIKVVVAHNPQVVLMQCNTNYTASLSNYRYINLNVLKTFAQLYPHMPLGLSDHTFGHATVLGAVTLGARVIEKHFTDDNTRSGPDHKFAMNPITWKEMVERTRELEFSLGDGIKQVEENEKETVIVQRRCIRVKHDLPKGTLINESDIEYLRPAPNDSFAPYEKDQVIGKKLGYAKVQGDYIHKGDLRD